MKYIVMCRVSGGITGTREAPLKDRDGKVIVFETREAAITEANDLNKKMNDQYRKADFIYWVTEAAS